jgi:hypothetical protein
MDIGFVYIYNLHIKNHLVMMSLSCRGGRLPSGACDLEFQESQAHQENIANRQVWN